MRFLIALALAGVQLVARAASPDQDPVGAMRDGRRALLEAGDAAPLRSLETFGGAWQARVRIVLGEPRGGEDSRGSDPALFLGIGGAELLVSLSGRPGAPASEFLALVTPTSCEPVALEALAEASRRAKTGGERAAVRGAMDRWLEGHPPPTSPRGAALLLLSRLRSTDDTHQRHALLAGLVQAVPDFPERHPGLLSVEETRDLRLAARETSLTTRLARARALAMVRADEASSLVAGSVAGAGPTERLDAAEILLTLGRWREAARDARSVGALAADAALADRARALAAAAELRGVSASTSVSSPSRRRRGKGRRPAPARSGRAAVQAPPGFDARWTETSECLLRPLPPATRRLLLEERVRSAASFGKHDGLKEAVRQLLDIEPGSAAGSEALFQQAFSLYRTGREGLASAASAFSELASLYRNVSVRRRSLYWQARALEGVGDEAARPLFASLLAGTSGDLYSQWAAAALGFDRAASHEPSAAFGDMEPPPPAVMSPSRELLALGLDGPAETAAEAEGSLDPVFAAAIASERGDFRRTTSLLKAVYPALGSPEEGAIPLGVRRLYYPIAHAPALREAAERDQVPLSLLCGLIRQESLFQARALSRSGAVGLMQVMPATGRLEHKREGGRGRVDLASPAENIRVGSRFFRRLLVAFDGDVVAALTAYNAGPGRVARWRRENAGLATDEWIEAIPFSETRDYVKRVVFFSGAYAALYRMGEPPSVPRMEGDRAVRPETVPSGPSRPFGGR